MGFSLLSPGDTYGILLDFNLVLSSITTSVEVIVENERKQMKTNDLAIFEQLYQALSSVQSVFARNFYGQYPSRNQL